MKGRQEGRATYVVLFLRRQLISVSRSWMIGWQVRMAGDVCVAKEMEMKKGYHSAGMEAALPK